MRKQEEKDRKREEGVKGRWRLPEKDGREWRELGMKVGLLLTLSLCTTKSTIRICFISL